MTRLGFCLECGADLVLYCETASDAPAPGFCAEHADCERARSLAATHADILARFGPGGVRREAIIDEARWARIHRHVFREWAPGSKCRNCGREAGHAVHA